MRKIYEVYPAEQRRSGAMGSLGNASCMYLRQFKFPHTYDAREKKMQTDHDHLMQCDHERTHECFKRHTGTGELALQGWLDKAKDEQVLAFLVDVLQADTSVAWTGYRVMGTVHRGNGFPVYTLELFAKHPESDTVVYTGPNAPNILPGTRYARGG